MSTRFYLASSGTPAETPSGWSSLWHNVENAFGPFPCSTTPSDTALVSKNVVNSSGAAYQEHGHTRWVSEALAAQTISGTVKGVIGCFENSSAMNANIAIAAKVIQPGGADRGELFDVKKYFNVSAQPPEMKNSSSVWDTRRFQQAADEYDLDIATPLAVTAGDFLVIEIGWYCQSANDLHNVTLRYGDPTAVADFTHADSLTTDLRPWVEFSGDIALAGTGPPLPLMAAHYEMN